jgi:hypothetical protein
MKMMIILVAIQKYEPEPEMSILSILITGGVYSYNAHQIRISFSVICWRGAFMNDGLRNKTIPLSRFKHLLRAA